MRGACAAMLFVSLGQSALAQPEGSSLNDTQRQGRELFNQSCRVCHSLPSSSGAPYGPLLNMDTQRGKDDLVAEIISDGTPRMPGFKHHFQPAQVNAIVAYLRTVPVVQAAPPPTSTQTQADRERQQREAD